MFASFHLLTRRKYSQILAVSVVLSAGLGCWSILPGAASAGVDSLETKLFMHDYAGHADAERLGRLENFVFGQSMSGTNEERIARLAKAMAVAQEDSFAANASQAQAPDNNYLAAAGAEPSPYVDADKNHSGDYADSADGSASNDLNGPAAGGNNSSNDDNYAGSSPAGVGSAAVGASDYESSVPPNSNWAGDGNSAEAGSLPPQGQAPDSAGRDNYYPSGTTQSENSAGGDAQMPPLAPPAAVKNSSAADRMPQAAPNIIRRWPQAVAAAPPYAVPVRFPGAAAPAYRHSDSQELMRRQVGVLELQLFGMTFVQQPLDQRLRRLESAVFFGAQAEPSASESERVRRLLSAPSIRARAALTNSAYLLN